MTKRKNYDIAAEERLLSEAKAAGLPIIALSAYGTKEMVADGEDGFLITLNAAQYSIHNCALRLEEGYKLAQELKEERRHK